MFKVLENVADCERLITGAVLDCFVFNACRKKPLQLKNISPENPPGHRLQDVRRLATGRRHTVHGLLELYHHPHGILRPSGANTSERGARVSRRLRLAAHIQLHVQQAVGRVFAGACLRAEEASLRAEHHKNVLTLDQDILL
jgi:hypothetical protein